MGTNYYLMRKKPRIVHDCYHIGKTSWGYLPTFQNSEKCDIEHIAGGIENDIPSRENAWNDSDAESIYFGSVADIRKLLESGEFVIIDEYGETGDVNGPYTIETITEWGRDHPDWRDHSGTSYYKDAEGYAFMRQEFC